MRIRWPEMYVAYHRGEELGRFFTIYKKPIEEDVKKTNQEVKETVQNIERRSTKKKPPTKRETQKNEWTQNKSEFCYMIKAEYAKDEKKYKNLRQATLKIFNQYKFPFKWKASTCYELVKKGKIGFWGINGENLGNFRELVGMTNLP